MDEAGVEDRLVRAELAIKRHHRLKGTGFWAAVAAGRRDRHLAELYADRIAAIDRVAFEQAIPLHIDTRRGLMLLWAGTGIGLTLLGLAAIPGDAATGPLLLMAWGVLSLSTHCLAHVIVGGMVGIRFTHVFVGHFPEPFPGVKIDYATYLRTPPRARALMHASGALASKVVPFAVLGVAVALDASELVRTILLVAGVAAIVLDMFGWFVAGDWKKVRRELKAARGGA